MTTDLLTIHALGGLSIAYGSRPVTNIASRKAEALLVYLAQTGHPQPRDTLAEVFWPERTQTRSLSSFRVTLTHLRKALAPFIDATRQTLALHPDMPVWLDAYELDDQLDLACRVADGLEVLSPTNATNLAQTLQLYRGDFLAGFHVRGCPAFEDWVRGERERIKHSVIHALDVLVRYALRTHRYATGMEHATRLLELDPLHEPTHRHLMQCLAHTGQRDSALAQYDICRELLADELGIEPDDATTKLFESIRAADIVTVEQTPVPRHNLPAQLTSFIGRKAELAQTHQLLNKNRLVTLLGPGGIGKSRLALEVAAREIANYTQGVFFVSLVGLQTPDAITPAIAEVLGLPFSETQRTVQEQLHDYLHPRHMLLVLDNFEHLLDGAPLVTDLLRHAPDVKVLVTSRERLNLSGEAVLSIGGLDVPDHDAGDDLLQHSSMRLFFEHAWRIRSLPKVDANQLSAAVRICHLLEGMPLGILLAATWADTLTLDEIASEITRNLDFLAADVRDMPPRHRSMRAVFESSWQRLSVREREVLMNLAVFRGGFSRPAAQEVTGASLRTLNSLVTRSLLRRRADGRFDLHELLRQFAYAMLAAQPDLQQRALDRHCAYYARFLHEHESDIRHGHLHQAVTELDNIRAMWQRAAHTSNHHAIYQAANALNWLCQRRGTEAEGYSMFTTAVDALRRPDPTDDQQTTLGLLLTYQGFFAYRCGKPAIGKACQMESHTMLRALDAREELAIALIAAGYCDSDIDQRDRYFEEALTICEETGPEWGSHMARKLRALTVLIPQGRVHEVAGLMQAELAYEKAHQDNDGINFSLNMLAHVAFHRQEFATAQQYIDEAILRAEAAGLRRNEVENYWFLGVITAESGDYEAAERAFEKSLALHEAYGIHAFAAAIHAELGHIAITGGNADRAAACFHEALSTSNHPEPRMSAAAGLALLASRGGDAGQAAAWLSALKHSPLDEPRLRRRIDAYLDEIAACLSASAFQGAIERGKTLDLHAIIQQLS